MSSEGRPEKDARSNITNNLFYPENQLHKLEDSVDYASSKNQGWVWGVFLPCLQNIIGIILFVRLPWITGRAGVGYALAILAVCKLTTILTALSMSAIATNGKIPAGGPYFMIARALGPSFGGSVGILYYLGLTFAVGMYVLGAVEVFISATEYEAVGFGADVRILSLVMIVFLWVINLVGLKQVNRLGVVFLVAMLFSILSIYLGIFTAKSRSLPSAIPGLNSSNLSENFSSEFSSEVGFHVLLAIFYPACTGIMSGSNRSGELKNPSMSIPRGTLAAVFTTIVIYITCIFLFGAVADREELIENVTFVSKVSWPVPALVTLGIIFSTLGAALQSLASAPRILVAIANDDLLPIRRCADMQFALHVTTAVSILTVVMGSLDSVAPVITMFFLLFYGFVNVACCLLSILGNPSWRPTWPYFHWSTALVGSVLCFTIMLYISWWAASVSFIMAGVLYCYIDMKAQAKNWGDGLTGLKQERAKKALLGVDPRKVDHVMNWKPQLLVLGFLDENDTPKDLGLVAMVEQLKKGNGLTIFGVCKVGEETKENFRSAKECRNNLHNYFKSKRKEIFCKVVLSKTIRRGMKNLIQTAGLGGLEPNTCMVSWPNNWRSEPLQAKRFCKLIEYSTNSELAVLCLKPVDNFELSEPLGGSIDIWWFFYDGGLMCLLAYLLGKHRVWRNCRVRIFYITTSEDPDLHNSIYQKIQDWVVNNRMFSKVESQVVVIPPEAIMVTKSQLKEQESRNSIVRNYKERTPMMILDEIEETQLRIAKDAIHREGSVSCDDQGMHLNKKIMEHSEYADLIITGLPGNWKDQSPDDYLAFCENMTKGLPRVLFVRGTENSVVTNN